MNLDHHHSDHPSQCFKYKKYSTEVEYPVITKNLRATTIQTFMTMSSTPVRFVRLSKMV